MTAGEQMTIMGEPQHASIVIRPGDRVLIPIVGRMTDIDRAELRDTLTEVFPGVTFLYIEGVTAGCGWLVYRA